MFTDSKSVSLTLERRSINRVSYAIRNYEANRTYSQILDDIQCKKIQILHCFGFPGSGKSQTLLKLAEDFSNNLQQQERKKSAVIRWHILCEDRGHNVKEELCQLSEELVRCHYITHDNCRSVQSCLTENEAGTLVDVLVECAVPVLIIVEDPHTPDFLLLGDLFRKLDTVTEEMVQAQFHVYVSSRYKVAIISEEESEKMPKYNWKHVSGFTEKEAVSFLNDGFEFKDNKSAVEVYKRFSGLPLGLRVARNYCKEAKISYSAYLENVEQVAYDLSNQRQEITNEYGESAEQLFQAIVYPFVPTTKSDIKILRWKILCCISYFHYDHLPRFVLEHCCNMLQSSEHNSKPEVGRLITKLLRYGMCSETEKGDLTFHEVVPNSFRLSQRAYSQDDEFDPLKKAIELMSGMVLKDPRRQTPQPNCILISHLQALLKHIKKNPAIFEAGKDLILTKALASRLYQITAATVAATSRSFSEETTANLQQSLKLIWPDCENFLNSKCQTDVEKLAADILDQANVKSKYLPTDFVVKYSSKLKYSFDSDDNESKFLNLKRSDIQASVSSHVSMEKLIRKMQDDNRFLKDDVYRSIFYAERVASVLHDWSRSCLFYDYNEDSFHEHGWKISLSYYIACTCKERYNTALVIEWVSQMNRSIPFLLKQKNDLNKLLQAKKICNEALAALEFEQLCYQDGLLVDAGHPKMTSRIILLRYIVRINSRLIKFNNQGLNLGNEDKECEDLYNLCQKLDSSQAPKSISFLINCAKYRAAKKEHQKSMMCFQSFFKRSSEPGFEQRFFIKCWAVYNYARAVCSFSLIEARDDAIQKCTEVLQADEVMRDDMNSLLRESLDNLKHLHAAG